MSFTGACLRLLHVQIQAAISCWRVQRERRHRELLQSACFLLRCALTCVMRLIANRRLFSSICEAGEKWQRVSLRRSFYSSFQHTLHSSKSSISGFLTQLGSCFCALRLPQLPFGIFPLQFCLLDFVQCDCSSWSYGYDLCSQQGVSKGSKCSRIRCKSIRGTGQLLKCWRICCKSVRDRAVAMV